MIYFFFFFFFSSRRRHTRFDCDWSSDVCSSDLSRVRGLHSAPADVFLADEAEMVAEVGPQLPGPFGVGGALPGRGRLDVWRDQMIERDIAAIGAGGAEAARAQDARHRGERRDMLR